MGARSGIIACWLINIALIRTHPARTRLVIGHLQCGSGHGLRFKFLAQLRHNRQERGNSLASDGFAQLVLQLLQVASFDLGTGRNRADFDLLANMTFDVPQLAFVEWVQERNGLALFARPPSTANPVHVALQTVG